MQMQKKFKKILSIFLLIAVALTSLPTQSIHAEASSGRTTAIKLNATKKELYTGLPGGTYTDAVTGDVQTVSEGGTLHISAPGQGNMRVYVLDTGSSYIDGAIGSEINGPYLK